MIQGEEGVGSESHGAPDHRSSWSSWQKRERSSWRAFFVGGDRRGREGCPPGKHHRKNEAKTRAKRDYHEWYKWDVSLWRRAARRPPEHFGSSRRSRTGTRSPRTLHSGRRAHERYTQSANHHQRCWKDYFHGRYEGYTFSSTLFPQEARGTRLPHYFHRRPPRDPHLGESHLLCHGTTTPAYYNRSPPSVRTLAKMGVVWTSRKRRSLVPLVEIIFPAALVVVLSVAFVGSSP